MTATCFAHDEEVRNSQEFKLTFPMFSPHAVSKGIVERKTTSSSAHMFLSSPSLPVRKVMSEVWKL